METPLIVGLLQDRAMTARLREIDCELVTVTSRKRLLAGEFSRRPRLFVLEARPNDFEGIQPLLRSLRHDWPLTDVLVWAPQASGAIVRTLFQLGAKDVAVSGSATNLVEIVQETLKQQTILPRLNNLSQMRRKSARFENMFSRSTVMWDLFELCTHVASTKATVLIVGETGTGKELLARAVHRHSARQGRFVAANCSSISPELVNSELFGHEKGAFTGADTPKRGLVRHADGGTLFLDEIGNMPVEAQQSLLRMLQEKRVRPVGSLTETKVDVRIVAATNVALDEAVRRGEFREDLFYRLDVIRMNVPPLRDRPEDILFLFGHFTKQYARHYGLDLPTFSDGFLDALLKHDWPGNVRQLENFSERLILARPRRVLAARDFAQIRNTSLADSQQVPDRAEPRSSHWSVDTKKSLDDNLAPLLQQLEQQYLESVLREHAGRVGSAAKQAGISRRTLLRKMKIYGIDKQEFR